MNIWIKKGQSKPENYVVMLNVMQRLKMVEMIESDWVTIEVVWSAKFSLRRPGFIWLKKRNNIQSSGRRIFQEEETVRQTRDRNEPKCSSQREKACVPGA